MGRFLIYFSYFGTRYSGLQRQTNLVKGKPIPTIQSALQDALKRLRPANDFKTVLSSRTDKGVHSLKNSCHVDLEYPEDGKEYDPDVITSVVNYGLEKDLHDVRVLETRRVSPTFHARLSAKERKYVYRLAHTLRPSKSDEEREEMVKELKKFFIPRHKFTHLPERDPLPMTDVYRVRSFRDTLDIPKLIAAAEACSGIHDYSSFTNLSKSSDDNYTPNPIKLLNIGVKRGQPFTHPLNVIGHNTTEHLEFWDIHVRARSFLFRQIRRLVGAMVLVAKNRISLNDLKDIIDRPQVNFPFASHISLEEAGLFLLDVAYDPEDLKFDDSECKVSSNEIPPVHKDEVQFHSSEAEKMDNTCVLDVSDSDDVDERSIKNVYGNDNIEENSSEQRCDKNRIPLQ